MNTIRHLHFAGLLLTLLLFRHGPGASFQDVPELAPEAVTTAVGAVRFARVSGGMCVVAGRNNAAVALAVARQGCFTVQALSDETAVVERMRRTIRRHGVYGSVSAARAASGRLPYAENLINIVVVDSWPVLRQAGLSVDEVLRVLAPLGTAQLGIASTMDGNAAAAESLMADLRQAGIEEMSVVAEGGKTWARFRKPWPAEIDEWTHYLHGADGNPVARDRVVGPPRQYQWLAGPTWLRSHETDSSVSTLVTARGRLFGIVDEAPISLAGNHPLPDKWSLVARDAFNGAPLWKVPIRQWGWREWKNSWFNTRPGDIPLNLQKRLVAVGERVYVTLGYSAPVSELAARTGETLQTYEGTDRTNEILYLDGTLLLSILDGDRIRIAAIDAATGKERWRSEKSYRGSTVDYIKWKEMHGGTEPVKLDPASNLACDGRVATLLDGREIVGLDFATGREKWRSAFPLKPADQNAGGMRTEGNLWVGTMIVADGVVLHASPHNLAALSADSGDILWSRPKTYLGHLWYEWKDVFLVDGLVWTWSDAVDQNVFETGGGRRQRTVSPRFVSGYDVKTGELVEQVPLGPIFKTHHHHRCYRNKATLNYILASRRGTECVALARHGVHTVDNWVRGTCHVGMMPANGLQYVPPHPCVCYLDEKINGLNALAPARPAAVHSPSKRLPLLEQGPAFATPGPPAHSDDWPAFRHDAMRTGASATRLPDTVVPLWRTKVGARLSAPIVAGGMLFVALVDEHHVAALDVTDGSKRWEFAAGARIDSPPTYRGGMLLFGSADGWVYCVRAADGLLAWRFHAAPEDRRIGAHGQFESAWPVHGSVLVQAGKAYFVAGRSSHLDGGLHLYAVEAATGELLHQTRLEGPRYTSENIETNYKLPMGSLPDILVGDGSNISMRSQAFDAELNEQKGAPELRTGAGFLDANYFKRTPWRLSGEYARLIVRDRESAYYVRMFDSLRGLDPTVFFTPAAQGYLLFAKDLGGRGSRWSERVPVRIRAMVLTQERLCTAGPPDMIDPEDPLGAFEQRKGGRLYLLDRSSGEKCAEYALRSPPVFNGIAAAGGRLYLCEEDGSVSCFGE